MSLIETACNDLLLTAGLDESKLQSILDNMLMPSIDTADLYMQRIESESWTLEDGIIKGGSFSTESGVGLRAISEEKTGFAYTNDLSLPALQEAATAARGIAKQGQIGHVALNKISPFKKLYSPENPLTSIEELDKIQFLKALDATVREQSPLVNQVIINLSAEHEIVLILNSKGQLVSDIRPLVRLGIQVIVEKNGCRESGYAGGGGRYTYEKLRENHLGDTFAQDAVRQALINLDAVAAPAGVMPVILGSGWPGVLLHEAVGHGLEGDFNRKGHSAFSGRLGERIASEVCTVVDDGTLPERRGSLSVDDEGTPTQCTVLIEKGILKNYMQDKLNAKLMGGASTGNGRRESYASTPIPRMTNTFMLNGTTAPQEIIASVDKGLYAVNLDGGQVDITSGKFVFSTSEAYLIENGKITTPVKGATLIGNGPDILTKVSMVGNDLQLDSGTGVCGKAGQSVPVGVGQPTLRIDALTVGGTST